MSAVVASLLGRLLCRLGFHQIHYEWKTKRPYCARSRPCKATDSFMRRLTRWAEG
jgi:hypothetical protein